jgi:hypothetical protein
MNLKTHYYPLRKCLLRNRDIRDAAGRVAVHVRRTQLGLQVHTNVLIGLL